MEDCFGTSDGRVWMDTCMADCKSGNYAETLKYSQTIIFIKIEYSQVSYVLLYYNGTSVQIQQIKRLKQALLRTRMSKSRRS